MTAPDMPRIRQDHALAIERAVTRLREKHRPAGGYVLYDKRTRDAVFEGMNIVLNLQLNQFDQLTIAELVAELQKKEGSVYWPLKADDPRFWETCERCHNKILITAEGICPDCGHELA